jgi:hypothetical protein
MFRAKSLATVQQNGKEWALLRYSKEWALLRYKLFEMLIYCTVAIFLYKSPEFHKFSDIVKQQIL